MVSLRTILAILALLNIKNWPFVFHLKFYYYVVKDFYILRSRKVQSVFQWSNYWTHTPLMEMDFNLHKSNSTYFSDMDMSRAALMCRVFKKFFRTYSGSDEDSPKLKKHQWTYTPLGGVELVFRREIKPYTPYNVKSRVFGWTNKWLYVISVFEVNGKLHAYGLSKYVFKIQRKTVSPEDAIKHCGLLDELTTQKNGEVQDLLERKLDLERIIDHA